MCFYEKQYMFIYLKKKTGQTFSNMEESQNQYNYLWLITISTVCCDAVFSSHLSIIYIHIIHNKNHAICATLCCFSSQHFIVTVFPRDSLQELFVKSA